MSFSDTSELSFQDVNASIREQVEQAVSRVAALHDPDHSASEEDLPFRGVGVAGDGPSSSSSSSSAQLSLEGVREQKREFEEEVRRLEAEVWLLEDELERRERPAEEATDQELERAIMSLARGRGEPHSEGQEGAATTTSTATEEEDRTFRALKSQIKLNEAFSGIQFKSAEWEVMRKDANVLHRKHTHTGSAYGFDFLVEFIAQEEKSAPLEPPDKAGIVALRAVVDPRLQKDLHSFVMRVSRDCNLMMFYQTYVKYCLLVHERRETFTKAKSLYGRNVQLSEGTHGSRLHFSIKRGPNLYFTWKVVVTDRGYIDHSLSMQEKMPSNASDDDCASASHLPQLLQKMTAVHGHEEGLLKMLALFHQME